MMDELELKPCPVCGRKPQIKRDISYESHGFGAWCTIKCKPLFKTHLIVEEGKSTWERALRYAIDDWNRRVQDE